MMKDIFDNLIIFPTTKARKRDIIIINVINKINFSRVTYKQLKLYSTAVTDIKYLLQYRIYNL